MNKNNIDIKIVIFLFGVTFACFAALLMLGRDAEFGNIDYNTFTHYGDNGQVIEQWTNVTKMGNGPGWCKIRTAEGEIVVISGSFKLSVK